MSEGVLPVGEVGDYIRQLTSFDPILSDLWVAGEVSNARQSRNGHLYFSLSDDSGSLRCVMFKSQLMRQRYVPANGDQVSVHGAFDFYVRSGDLQLIADLLQPAGIGLAALELERLRLRLEAEGLFETSRKRPLPTAPKMIGVVTSPAGSVWHDIQHIIGRRFPLTHLLLAPASVQGAGAVESLVSALEALARDGRSEVIIVARGGGSAEDLAPFNDERLVRAIYTCPIPVVAAIGHETDFSLADFVADLRASTPSAAAELCVPSVVDYQQELATIQHRLAIARTTGIAPLRQQIKQVERRFRLVGPGPVIDKHRATLPSSMARLQLTAQTSNRELASSVQRSTALLQALNPWAVLDRGYAMLNSPGTGVSINRAKLVSAGSLFEARFADGVVGGRVSWVRTAPTNVLDGTNE